MRTFHSKFNYPPRKFVEDRKCPGCKENHLTPFLYNMHKCALQTSQCGGCNLSFRQLLDMQRHLPKCPKAYKIYAQNIPIVEDLKPQVDEGIRIKNEAVLQGTEEEGAEIRKTNKKSASSNDFKRVDNLLRVTMNTLESIKQEPNIHMENNVNNRWQNEDNNFNNEAQFQDDDDGDNNNNGNKVDDNSNNNSNQQMPNEPIVQLSEGSSFVNIKQEPDHNELPIPRIKIKKEHGTLNLSVVNNENNNQHHHQQIETDTNLQSEMSDNHVNNNNNNNRMPIPGILRIKQERMDVDNANRDWNNISSVGDSETMGLSSIRISHVTSGIVFNSDMEQDEQQQQQQSQANDKNPSTSTIMQDIKPNIAELNKSLNVKRRRVSAAPSRMSATSSRVIVKTEPIDRDIVPRITSVTAGVNMLGFNIKTEIKSEPQQYENHTENWHANSWQQPQNVIIKQENVRIKQEPLGNNIATGISGNKNRKSRVAREAETNETDDQEVIILDSPPPFINLEPDMEIINLDSPCSISNEDTEDMEVINSAVVPINSEDSKMENIDEINDPEESNENEMDKEIGHAEKPVNEGDAGRTDELANVDTLDNKGEAEKLTGHAENTVNKDEAEKVEEIAHAETFDNDAEGEKIGEKSQFEIDNEGEAEEEIGQIEAIDNEEETEKEEEITNVQAFNNEGKAEKSDYGDIVDTEEKVEIGQVEALDKEKEDKLLENKDEIGNENKIDDDEIVENVGKIVQEPIELPNYAQPFEKTNDLEEEVLVEEQQNELNQQRDNEILTEHEISKVNTEEVENVLNESVDPASQFLSLQNIDSRSSSSNNNNHMTYTGNNNNNNTLIFSNNQILFDNNNINEIAENNNNANIERELLEVNATESISSNIQPDACL